MNRDKKESFDLYGFYSGDLNKIVKQLDAILLIDMVLHESSYLGGDYYRYGMPGQEEFILQHNFDEMDNELAEPEFEQYVSLLYVGPTKRSDEIKELILERMKGEVNMLRHEVL